ncbi:uncharacterized protein GVI51_J02057 [Nakaseomyces glabratus]|uniref:RRM domain-containing protein n=2 Tax=Candida glabrata TaxID=5478 RepID=F2Z6F7_CANGA|nr:uncharacterized protein CAGL0J02200g [Nakaseomyces glabratus]KAH7583894.1 Eukaryotic RNA Recognition Motif (RRM) profile [Nakaseomyces glabratus]KAH7585136.1 Eukaryotic RNA Recognition Motif (RRM) profile [Nakaseomyces glabratus]KAH7587128.1 Eukaryotic RNA Recognition Motif (RRM) profile [Nakaseomyces glabratus]KAH7597639.1 Eukaryotic RNA Recognition Motif (RRM) profile [Nakaseomyces glabratus]KAH7612384.1 Eukaryotic RNA Recognition Motif (RRM) profile [Nakaseomyces glabratus]|eukprot:XP_447800.1 uncharacterized protein CAGL0J02200g [[Candida] glabrata]
MAISPQKISEIFENLNVSSNNVTTQSNSRLTREQKHALQLEADACSIYIGNISLDTTPEEIDEHFKSCGVIKRITMLYDKNTGPSIGYAYVEFDSIDSRDKALDFNGTNLRQHVISVERKRTNIPNYKQNTSNNTDSGTENKNT